MVRFRNNFVGMRQIHFTDLVVVALLSFLIPHATLAVAQPSASSVFPRSCMPGTTTRVVVTGKGFSDPMRVATNREQATVVVVAIEEEQVMLDVTLPSTVPLGPLEVWLASAAGSSDPMILMADDLPPVAQQVGNVSIPSAQSVPTLCVVEGISQGPQGAFFKFEVTANQRLAFEVLTQAIQSKMDPVVRLYDQEGQVLLLADDDEIGPECRFAYQFAAAGTYWIEIHDNRYTSGLHYQLRIGDFPIVRHASPPAVTAGQVTTVAFAGQDGAASHEQSIELPESRANTVTTVATRLEDGKSSAWVPILVSGAPVYHEDQSAADTPSPAPLNYPLTIAGRLSEFGEKDRYPIQGVQGTTVRFAARQRSLGCPTTLTMQLLKEADAPVAQTQVADTDEWSFDFAFPDDCVYHLEVTDLLGRGGTDFGYVVELIPAGSFALNLKPDAAVRRRFDVEGDQGAAAIDLQVDRFGYAGAIDLALVDPPPGLRIVNPQIAAGANDSRIYVMADDQWSSEAHEIIRLRGRATDNADFTADLKSLSWQRAKAPHVPFPIFWQNGAVVFSGVAAGDPWFSLEPVEPIRLARPVQRHEVALNLQRLQEGFKAAVVLMSDAAPGNWSAEIKGEARCLQDRLDTPRGCRRRFAIPADHVFTARLRGKSEPWADGENRFAAGMVRPGYLDDHSGQT